MTSIVQIFFTNMHSFEDINIKYHLHVQLHDTIRLNSMHEIDYKIGYIFLGEGWHTKEYCFRAISIQKVIMTTGVVLISIFWI